MLSIATWCLTGLHRLQWSATTPKAVVEKHAAASSGSIDVDQFVHNVVHKPSNVFLFGPCGYGKSDLMKTHLVPALKRFYGQEHVLVTASTGLAALAIHGATIHSLCGMGLGKGSAADILARQHPKVRARLQHCKCLLVDEISMVPADLFGKLDQVLRSIRRLPGVPFGGVKLIIVGDFAQLPPPSDIHSGIEMPMELPDSKVTKAAMVAAYAFESESWRAAEFTCYRLTYCWR